MCLPASGNSWKPQISPPGSRKSAPRHFSLCSRAFRRAPDQNFICSVKSIQQMFNIYIHIGGRADPTHHRPTPAQTFSCEQLQPGIWEMAVQRVLGVTVSQRASPLNVAICSQKRREKINPLYAWRSHMRPEANFSAGLLYSVAPCKKKFSGDC